MRYRFSTNSKIKLNSCHFDLQVIINEALAYGIMDISVIEGHRNKEKQDRYFSLGQSKVKWPNSKHNKTQSDAVDVAPFVNGKISWNRLHCCVLAGIILASAERQGAKIRWGGNWDMDGEPITDQAFQDLVHFERVKK